MSQPELSVLMPVRDAAATLRTALRSLERQTFEDFEIIAVDDGSRDGSRKLLESWALRDQRLRVVSPGAVGLVAALEAGRGECRGDLIARMDADDAMLPSRLAIQVELLRRRPDLSGVSCRIRCFPSSRIAGGFKTYEAWLNALIEPEDIARERFIESPLVHPSVVVRRAVLEQVGGYRDLGWAEDYDLWLRLLESGHRFAKSPEILHLWRDHPHRQTRVHERYGKKKFLALKAHFLARGPLQAANQVMIWGAGPTGRGLAKALRGEGVEVSAFLDIDSKKLGRRPGGAPVHLFSELPRMWQPGSRLLVAVSRRGARELIRPHIRKMVLEEGSDVWFVA